MLFHLLNFSIFSKFLAAIPAKQAAYLDPGSGSFILQVIIASLVGWIVASDWIGSENRAKVFAGVFLAALAGTIVDHSFGSTWALILFQLPREIWLAVLALAPWERVLFSLGAAIIGTPLLIGLPKIGVLVGQSAYEEEELETE